MEERGEVLFHHNIECDAVSVIPRFVKRSKWCTCFKKNKPLSHEGHVLSLAWHNSHAFQRRLCLACLIWIDCVCSDLLKESVWRAPAVALVISSVFFLHGFIDLMLRHCHHWFLFFLSLFFFNLQMCEKPQHCSKSTTKAANNSNRREREKDLILFFIQPSGI